MTDGRMRLVVLPALVCGAVDSAAGGGTRLCVEIPCGET